MTIRTIRTIRTTRTRTTRKKGEETRDRIHAAALSLFRKKGFEATTMRDVAAAAEVALGAAYYYFPSKEAIVLAYYERTHAKSTAQVLAVFAESDDVRARLGATFHAKLDVLAKDRKLLSGLFRSVADPSAEASIFGERTRSVREESIVLFDRAIAPAPEIAALDAGARRVLALALWSLHMGVLLYFIHDVSPKQRKTRGLVDRSLDLVVALLPLAPQLAPTFGDAIGSILASAGLLGAPAAAWRREAQKVEVSP
jgi:AcrR family transcriptional regulator